ncbi:DUF4838 domain-containing protein, partial [Acidobacteria bacterium AH-259-O06]|nr:DUF4838 domain-containing protein [Acidobacteria bacterium AH-259-O06]
LFISETPAFEYRALMLFPFNIKRALEDIDWMAKNRLNVAHVAVNSSREGPVLGLQLWHKYEARKTFLPQLEKRGIDLHFGGHTFFVWVPPETYFESHPEYFSLIGGERMAKALCLSYPDLAEVAARNMIQFLDENPEVDILDCWNNDVSDWCECQQCQVMEGSTRTSIVGRKVIAKSNSALQFVNSVASRVKEGHPGVQINLLAYDRILDTPTRVQPAENVLVGFASISRVPRSEKDTGGYYKPLYDRRDEVNRVHLEELKKWAKLTDNLYMYDYFVLWKTLSGSRKIRQGRNMEFYPMMDTIPKDLWLYTQLGIKGVSTEQFDWNEVNMYLYPRVAWNPNQSAAVLIDRFCRQFYGQAYAPMLEHWLTLAEAKGNWRKERDRCLDLIEQALNLTQDSQVRGRIERLKKIWSGWVADQPFRDTRPFPFEP